MDDDESLQMLLDSFVAVGSEPDIDGILDRVLDLARVATQARFGAIALLDDNGIGKHVFQGLGPRHAEQISAPSTEIGVMSAVLEGETLRLDHLSDHPKAVKDAPGGAEMDAFLGVPIVIDGQTAGAICLTKPTGQKPFDDRNQLFLQSLSRQAGNAIRTALALSDRDLEIEHRRVAQRNAGLLQRVAAASNQSSTLRQAIEACLPAVCRLLDAQLGHAYLTRGSRLVSSGLWYCEDGAEYTEFKEATNKHVFISGVGMPGRIHETQEPIWVKDLASNPVFRRSDVAQKSGFRTAYGFPVVADERVAAVFELFSSKELEPDLQLMELMKYMGGQLGQVHRREQFETELRQADEAKTDFVAMVSHEVRTPMTSMLGFASTLHDHWTEIEEKQKRDFVKIIHEQAGRLTRLTDDVLTMSRVESGRIEARPGDVVVADAADECLTFLGAVADGVESKVDRSIAVHADPDHLQQILLNYLTNALKYGGAPITIEATKRGGIVSIFVSDKGPGVTPALDGKVFDKFSQLDTGSRRTASGTGIGLSIVRGLAAANKGKAYFEANKPVGARFAVDLIAAGENRS